MVSWNDAAVDCLDACNVVFGQAVYCFIVANLDFVHDLVVGCHIFAAIGADGKRKIVVDDGLCLFVAIEEAMAAVENCPEHVDVAAADDDFGGGCGDGVLADDACAVVDDNAGCAGCAGDVDVAGSLGSAAGNKADCNPRIEERHSRMGLGYDGNDSWRWKLEVASTDPVEDVTLTYHPGMHTYIISSYMYAPVDKDS